MVRITKVLIDANETETIIASHLAKEGWMVKFLNGKADIKELGGGAYEITVENPIKMNLPEKSA